MRSTILSEKSDLAERHTRKRVSVPGRCRLSTQLFGTVSPRSQAGNVAKPLGFPPLTADGFSAQVSTLSAQTEGRRITLRFFRAPEGAEARARAARRRGDRTGVPADPGEEGPQHVTTNRIAEVAGGVHRFPLPLLSQQGFDRRCRLRSEAAHRNRSLILRAPVALGEVLHRSLETATSNHPDLHRPAPKVLAPQPGFYGGITVASISSPRPTSGRGTRQRH